MKNYHKSDYALNKFRKGIVYHFADKFKEITLADYLRENPDKTEADFAKMKALSDELYLEQARSDYRKTHKDVPLSRLEELSAHISDSPEDAYIAGQDKHTREIQKQKAHTALDLLTKIQRRRYLLHTVKGMSTRQIASIEGVKQSQISKSLNGARKKIKKFLENL